VNHWKTVSALALAGLLLGGSVTHTYDTYVYQSTPQIYRWLEEVETSEPDLLTSSPDLLTMLEPYLLTPPSNVSNLPPIPSKPLEVPQGIRLMVFTPHPDDETLAAGGLIQRVRENGGTVSVVFITNGDGFMEGVRRFVKRDQTSASDFLEYGKRRYKEALCALVELGLDTEAGIFLGFPDDGIDDLWSVYWSKRKPYTSPYTRFDHPHYAEAYDRWIKYAGVDLKDKITQVMSDFLPDWVVVPDPRDIHPDHCATAVFVLDALCKLREEEDTHFLNTQVFSYLVHYMDYPSSTMWTKEVDKAGVGGSVTGDRILSAIKWFNLPLSEDEILGKQHALSAHQTQVLTMGEFLRQFLRPVELFGKLEPSQVQAIPREWSAHFNRPIN
jgi:LmbE family N-acetylglucosaminyl deacetylase